MTNLALQLPEGGRSQKLDDLASELLATLVFAEHVEVLIVHHSHDVSGDIRVENVVHEGVLKGARLHSTTQDLNEKSCDGRAHPAFHRDVRAGVGGHAPVGLEFQGDVESLQMG